MKEKSIKPCPWCKETKVQTEIDTTQGYKYGYAFCCFCFAHGPEVRSDYNESENAPWREKAIERWNERKI